MGQSTDRAGGLNIDGVHWWVYHHQIDRLALPGELLVVKQIKSFTIGQAVAAGANAFCMAHKTVKSLWGSLC